jgi:hypothetical protein
MRVKYDDADQTRGVLTIDGVEYFGPIPPEAGDLRAIYEAELEGAEIIPFEPPASSPVRVISVLEFLERFSQQKRIAIRAAARQSDSLADWLDLLMAAQVVDLDDPRTLGGVAAMTDAGLLTEAEALAVLA